RAAVVPIAPPIAAAPAPARKALARMGLPDTLTRVPRGNSTGAADVRRATATQKGMKRGSVGRGKRRSVAASVATLAATTSATRTLRAGFTAGETSLASVPR